MFRRLLREYFSLTRAERRGIQVLGFLILILAVFRGFLPQLIPPTGKERFLPGDDFANFQQSLQHLGGRLDEGGNGPDSNHHRLPEPFFFDPNNAGYDTLVLLGLSSRTARTLVNFRKAGAVFETDSDLLRVYGMGTDEFSRLRPFIRMGPGVSREPHPSEERSFRLFELNGADSLQLVSVYGIGPVFARRIMRYRELLGGFYCTEQLLEVYGLNPRQYEELVRRSFLDTTLLRKIHLNSLDAGELALHPYLDRYQALALVAFREQSGPFRDPLQVKENRLLPDSLYRKIRPYLEANR